MVNGAVQGWGLNAFNLEGVVKSLVMGRLSPHPIFGWGAKVP